MKKFLLLSVLTLFSCSKEASEPEIIRYTLTVTAGDGGSVSSLGGTYSSGTQVSITAIPNSGFNFSGWSNGSIENPLILTMNTNTQITASFSKITFPISVSANPPEGGNVNPESGDYEQGETVTIIASANEFYQFQNWSGDWNSDEESITLTIDSGKTLTANFIKVDDDEDGVLNVNDACENSSGEVDENGCDPSQKDDDNDGFNNAIDQCPNTPSHDLVEVDSNGCKINYIYIDNGTVKAYTETPVGTQDVLFEQVNQFINYNGSPQIFTVISRGELIDKIRNGEYLDNLVTSKITDMGTLFHSSYYDGVVPEINGNLSAWDVSNVTSFAIMFLENQEAHKLVLTHWDTSSATSMFGMFRKSSYGGVFNQIYNSKLNKISNWDVSNVTDMGFMFDSTFFDHDISNWDVSKVTRMKKMFYNNQYFNISIGGWDVSNVTDMSEMFAHPFNFGGGFNKDISNWNVSNVTDCTNFDLNSSSNWTDSNKPNFTNCNPN